MKQYLKKKSGKFNPTLEDLKRIEIKIDDLKEAYPDLASCYLDRYQMKSARNAWIDQLFPGKNQNVKAVKLNALKNLPKLPVRGPIVAPVAAPVPAVANRSHPFNSPDIAIIEQKNRAYRYLEEITTILAVARRESNPNLSIIENAYSEAETAYDDASRATTLEAATAAAKRGQQARISARDAAEAEAPTPAAAAAAAADPLGIATLVPRVVPLHGNARRRHPTGIAREAAAAAAAAALRSGTAAPGSTSTSPGLLPAAHSSSSPSENDPTATRFFVNKIKHGELLRPVDNPGPDEAFNQYRDNIDISFVKALCDELLRESDEAPLYYICYMLIIINMNLDKLIIDYKQYATEISKIRARVRDLMDEHETNADSDFHGMFEELYFAITFRILSTIEYDAEYDAQFTQQIKPYLIAANRANTYIPNLVTAFKDVMKHFNESFITNTQINLIVNICYILITYYKTLNKRAQHNFEEIVKPMKNDLEKCLNILGDDNSNRYNFLLRQVKPLLRVILRREEANTIGETRGLFPINNNS
jgi:hypothetical protein